MTDRRREALAHLLHRRDAMRAAEVRFNRIKGRAGPEKFLEAMEAKIAARNKYEQAQKAFKAEFGH